MRPRLPTGAATFCLRKTRSRRPALLIAMRLAKADAEHPLRQIIQLKLDALPPTAAS